MNDRPMPGAWDDERIDRLLVEALSVEPSPDLRARVRARVADQSAGRIRPAWPWLWAGAAAAVAGLALIVAPTGGWWSDGSQTAAQDERPRLQGTGLAPWAPFADGAPLHPVPALASALVLSPAAKPGDGPATPHVPEPVFAPGDGAAFRLLLAYSRATRPVEGAALPAAEPGLDPTELPPVTIPPIEIAAIDIPAPGAAGVLEGEPQ